WRKTRVFLGTEAKSGERRTVCWRGMDSKFQFRATLSGLAGRRDPQSGQRRRVASEFVSTHSRRGTDSNFQFLGLGRAFLYRLGVTAPFLASSRNASGTAFVASNRGRPRRRVTLTPRLMTYSSRSALRRSGCELWKRRTTEAVWWMRCQT